MRHILLTALTAIPATLLFAAIPEGYYNSLDGKAGESLSKAVGALADGHTVLTYSTKIWPAFETTDVRMIDGREAWWDMYSNNIVWLPAHDALNIEHSVANSWWGGKNGSKEAYADLFHLNPSDQDANNSKKNNPPGIVADARLFDNGIIRVGTPADGMGGGSKSVFEPADEYKGDFARAYLYVFTAYEDLAWDEEYAYVYGPDGKLQDWAIDLLLDWNRLDPVDSKEIARNDRIYELQHNRNPFIDYPRLAEYIWGQKAGESFALAEQEPAEAIDRPEAPAFGNAWMRGVNTYARRWWDGININLDYPTDATLMFSYDGSDFYTPTEFDIDPAADADASHILRAYSLDEQTGLRSPVATLTLNALDPFVTDYSVARWVRVDNLDQVPDDDERFIILSSNTLHAMSTVGGTSSKVFMQSAGFVRFDEEGRVVELPVDAAVVSFSAIDGSPDPMSRLDVRDVRGNYIGAWNATAKNKMKLGETYTPGTMEIDEAGAFRFTFSQFGSLQFNKSQPRFLNYASKQTPVYLYRFLDFNGCSGIDSTPADEDEQWSVGVDGADIILPDGALLFDLSGRPVNPRALAPGIYIVTAPGHSLKIRI